MFKKIIFGLIAVMAIYEGSKYLDTQNKIKEANRIVAIQQEKADVLINKADKLIKRRGANKLCKSIEGLARTIMEKRQEGISMSAMMNAIGENNMHRELIKLAYNKTRYNTEKYKQKSIEEFANKAALTCYNSIE